MNGHHHGDHFSGGHVILFIGLQYCIKHQGHGHHGGCHVLQLIIGKYYKKILSFVFYIRLGF